jgi:hypothetical protein
MTAINKNFIVKNGLQVGNDLIVANADSNKVGIASTIPTSTLSVGGQIAADQVVVSGVSTLTQLKGTQASYTQVDAGSLYAASGIVTALTGSNINVSGEVKSNRLVIGIAGSIFSVTSAGVGVGTTLPTQEFEVVGDANVTGALSALVVNSNVKSTGVSTFARADIANLQATDINIIGISTLGFANATKLTVSSNTTLGITTVTGSLVASQINVTGVTTIGNVNVTQINATGFSTFSYIGVANSVAIGTDRYTSALSIGNISEIVSLRGGLSVKTLPNSSTIGEAAIYIEEQSGNEGWYLNVDVDGDLNFNNSSSAIHSVEFLDNDDVLVRKGNLGIGTTNATDALTVFGNARITGVTTLTSTTTSALNATQLNVSGVSTFAGITTVTGSTLFSKQLNVSGVSTFVDATTHQKGISVTGVANVTGVNATGIITASSFSGNATSATYASNAGVATYASTAGVSTYTSNAGVATYASTAGVSTSVNGGTGDLTQLNVTGVSTLGVTGVSQLNVTGVSTFAGITTVTGSTLFSKQLWVSGVTTVTDLKATQTTITGVSTLGVVNGSQLSITGVTTLSTTNTNGLGASQLNVSGVSTLGVTGASQLNVTGVTTVTDLKATQTTITGVSTLGIVNGSQLSITGVTTATDLKATQTTISGVSTLGVTTATVLSTNTLRVAGISTYVTGPILVGSATSTGTADQKLQVTGKAYVSSSVGIGSTNPTTALDVVGNVKVVGTVSADSFSGTGIVTSIIDGAGSDAVLVAPGVYKIDLYGSAIGEAWGTVQNGSGEIGVRTDVLVGMGTTVPPEYTLDVYAKYAEEAARFLVQGSNIYAPFIVNSNVQVNNLNAQYLGGKSAPSGTIVGTTDSQTLTNKTLTVPVITGTGATYSGATSGSVTLKATAIAGSNTITLPATTGNVVTTGDSGTVTGTIVASDTITNTNINSAAAIAYSKLNLASGIVNNDINASAAIAITKLASSTISGISLGSNLNNLTIGSYLTQNGQTYNGSTARTVAVDADSLNTASKVVVRDGAGNFAAGIVTVTTLSATNENVSGISTLGNLKTLPLLEKVNVVAGTANATTNIDVLTSNVWMFTTAATANWTHNIRGNASISLNTLMATGDSIVVTILAKCGVGKSYSTDITIDGGAQTEMWAGGTAPTAGLSTANYDMYTWTIVKTASATFSVFPAQSQFGA